MPTDNNNANQMNDSNIGLPQQQNGAPQPGVADGGADPAVNTDGVNDVNVQQQNAGLIDDVTDGNLETGTNQQPINSLDDANNAFLRILQGGSAVEGTGEQPVTEPAPNGTEGNAGTEPTASEGTNNSDTTAEPTATGTEPTTFLEFLSIFANTGPEPVTIVLMSGSRYNVLSASSSVCTVESAIF